MNCIGKTILKWLKISHEKIIEMREYGGEYRDDYKWDKNWANTETGPDRIRT